MKKEKTSNPLNLSRIKDAERKFIEEYYCDIYRVSPEFYTGTLLSPDSLVHNHEILSYFCGKSHREASYIFGESCWRELFNNLTYVATGVYGIVYRNSNFIFKFASFRKYSDDILHEFYIAENCTNKLRLSGILNFCYCYGVGKSALPLLDRSKVNFNICPFYGSGDDYFCIMENIEGETLRSTYQNITLEEYLNYTLQVLCAIETASDENFTHYDLHDGNIILRKHEAIINYKRCSLKTFRIATIIDTGLSYIKKGIDMGYPGDDLRNYGVLNQHNSLTDAYKLLCYTLLFLFKNETKYLKIQDLVPLFAFFNPHEDARSAITQQSKFSFFYPPSEKTLSEYISYIFECYPFCKTFVETNHDIRYFNGNLSEIPRVTIEHSPYPIAISISQFQSLPTLTFVIQKWMREVIKFVDHCVDENNERNRELLKAVREQVKHIFKKIYYEYKDSALISRMKEVKKIYRWYFEDLTYFESMAFQMFIL